ncbi:hypothetical protein C9374_000721 [Naegleria lovaniensis]|uniref:PUM-HD domain-containing protein n=1 Tax=Naegleria lovaniensis TaxID=51637 RepID=A0AA88KTB6_NAELO|nr:uncharacterized protein C9374_000721 [Naegleria lovaniensis]KAG2388557.1 hypothetical protein C9374_000721 [Naegleria lovaniensis]
MNKNTSSSSGSTHKRQNSSSSGSRFRNNSSKPSSSSQKQHQSGKNNNTGRNKDNNKKKNEAVKRLHSEREDAKTTTNPYGMSGSGGIAEYKKRKNKEDSNVMAKRALDEFLKLGKKKRKQKTDILEEVLHHLQGSISSVSLRSDMSRLLQAILKYGTDSQRKLVVNEIKNDLRVLSANIYGHQLVKKVMKYHALKIKDDKERLEFYKEVFFGNMKTMIQQRFSGEVLDYCYTRLWNYTEKRFFVQEFYGSEFLWTTEESKMNDSLKDSISSNKEGAKSLIVSELNAIVQTAIQKRLIDLTIVQKLIIDIFECGENSHVKFTLYDLIECNAIPLILHTLLGCKISLLCISYANEKERKMIVRALSRSKVDVASAEEANAAGEGENATEDKTKEDDLINNDPHNSLAVLAAQDNFGSVVISYLFKCIDDTVLLNQKILKHFRKILSELFVHAQASRPILYLLTGNSKCLCNSEGIKLFDHLELRKELLKDGALSKKGQDKIRHELLLSFGPSLATAICENMNELLTNQHGHGILKEAATLYPQNKDFENVAKKLKDLMQNQKEGSIDFSHALTKTTLSYAIMESKEGGFCDMAFEVVKGKCKQYIFEKKAPYIVSALLKTRHGRSVYDEIVNLKTKIEEEKTDKNFMFLAKVLATKKEEYEGK